MMGAAPVVVSIQSFVSYGYVGNSAAMPPLLSQGLEVIPVHTVIFSSHPGYRGWAGTVVDEAQLGAILDALELRLAQTGCDGVLLGYLSNEALASRCWRFVERLAAMFPALKVFCDPVLGDQGQLYVAPEMLAFYRQRLGLAQVLLPNQDELSWLMGEPIETVAQAERAVQTLSARYDARVICTGVNVEESPELLYVVGSAPGEPVRQWAQARVAGEYAGCGDVFSAMVAGAMLNGKPAEAAIEAAVEALGSLVSLTHQLGLDRLAMSAWLATR